MVLLMFDLSFDKVDGLMIAELESWLDSLDFSDGWMRAEFVKTSRAVFILSVGRLYGVKANADVLPISQFENWLHQQGTIGKHETILETDSAVYLANVCWMLICGRPVFASGISEVSP
jgi:hypothetical protein